MKRRVRPLTTVVVVVAFVVGGGIWWLYSYLSGPSSADCAPVRELLSFNKTQIEAMNAKTHEPAPGSFEGATEPSVLDYRAWSDGLTDRAARVTAADLSGPAKDTAETAERLVQARVDFEAQAQRTAPGSAMPPAGVAVRLFNEEFDAQVKQLAEQCPA